MSFSIDFIHGLVFGIAHADSLYVEVDDEEVYEATGIVDRKSTRLNSSH